VGSLELLEQLPNLHGVVFLDSSEDCVFRDAVARRVLLRTYNDATWPRHVKRANCLLEAMQGWPDDPTSIPLHIFDLNQASAGRGLAVENIGRIILKESMAAIDDARAFAANNFEGRLRQARDRIHAAVIPRTADHVKQNRRYISVWLNGNVIMPVLEDIHEKLKSHLFAVRLRGMCDFERVSRTLFGKQQMASEEFSRWLAAIAIQQKKQGVNAPPVTQAVIGPCKEAFVALCAIVDPSCEQQSAGKAMIEGDEEAKMLVNAIAGALMTHYQVMKSPVYRRQWLNSVQDDFFSMIADFLQAGLCWLQDPRFQDRDHWIGSILSHSISLAISCMFYPQSERFMSKLLKARPAVMEGVVISRKCQPVLSMLLDVVISMLRTTTARYAPDATFDPIDFLNGLSLRGLGEQSEKSVGEIIRDIRTILARHPDLAKAVIRGSQVDELLSLANECCVCCGGIVNLGLAGPIRNLSLILLDLLDLLGTLLLSCSPAAEQSLLNGIPALIHIAATCLLFHKTKNIADGVVVRAHQTKSLKQVYCNPTYPSLSLYGDFLVGTR